MSDNEKLLRESRLLREVDAERTRTRSALGAPNMTAVAERVAQSDPGMYGRKPDWAQFSIDLARLQRERREVHEALLAAIRGSDGRSR